MRLIDADRLIETLNNDIASLNDKPDSLAKTIVIKAAEFFIQDIQDVNVTPTAYDIDKVVEKLEEEREEILNSNDYESEIINYCLDSFDDAIEIVKAGGNE